MQVRAEAGQRELGGELDHVSATIEGLNLEMEQADQSLAAATTKAERDRVAAKQIEIRGKQAEVQARIDRLRMRTKPNCPPDQPLC